MQIKFNSVISENLKKITAFLIMLQYFDKNTCYYETHKHLK